MTVWAARGCFEEMSKGSIETGKSADFVILDKDIMIIPESEIPKAVVKMLFIKGIRLDEK